MKLFPLVFCVLLLAGCAAPAPAEVSPKDEVVVVLSIEAEPESGFDPAYGWGAGEHVHEPLIQSTLTVTNADLTVGFDLATSLSASGDGLTWAVDIRNDAVFSDGVPLTAQDVAFTYNTLKETTSVSDFTMLDSAEAQDDETVLFHLNKPFSIWPYTMSTVGILPQHAYDPALYGGAPVGSGRYLLQQWDRGQQVILRANPRYYGEAPAMKKVTVLFLSEDAAHLAAQAGQADLVYTSAPYAGGAVAGYSLLSVDTVDNRGINLPKLPQNVREAIDMGIDRETLIRNVLDGHGTPAYSVCDGLPWGNPAPANRYDPEGAKALLDREVESVALNLLYPAGDAVRQGLAAELTNQLNTLGVAATYEAVGWDTAYDRAEAEPLIWGWGAHTPMEVYNIYHGASAAVDALLDEALSAPTAEASYPLWQGAQARDETTWVWLVNVNHLFWVRDGLQVAEQKIHPHGHGWSVVNNVDRWSWEG